MTTCALCDLPAEPPVPGNATTETFCCPGCRQVYETLDTPGEIDHEGAPSTSPEKEAMNHPETAETAFLAVDGMHCTTCERYLETVARGNDGVYDASASYAAETIKLSYDPETYSEGELPALVSGMGYRARAQADESTDQPDHASRLLVGGLFGMMAMTWYAIFLYPTYFGFDPVVSLGQFDSAYLSAQLAVVTAIILLYTGQPILRGAYVSLRTRQPNVDLLVTIAAVAAYLYSTGRVLVGASDLYYDVTIVVVLAVTVGEYYETRIKRSTSGLLADLTEQQVTEARRVDGQTIPVDDIEPGETLLVRPGERIPVDGTVRTGTAAVDQALVTGEALPETKRPGDTVRGGTIVTDSPIELTAGEDAESTLDRIVELLWDIQASRPGAQRVADRLATIFVPLVLLLALGVSGLLVLGGASVQTAILVGLTVLIVSCPCALGLATPLAVARGLQAAATRGIVIASPTLFENGDDVDTVVFDKTGTLTDGTLSVSTVFSDRETETELLRKAAAVEHYTQHPIATAIVDAAPSFRPDGGVQTAISEDESETTLADFEQLTRGVTATVEGDQVLVGHPAVFEAREYKQSTASRDAVAAIESRGALPVVVGWNGVVRGVIAIEDTQREEWEAALEAVGADRQVVVVTGDDGPRAERLHDHPAVDSVFAGVPPAGKAETIDRLATTGTVAMVGDGSNDAPALAAADVGIAMGGASQLATDAADAVILERDLRAVPTIFEISDQTNRRISENIGWAFGYNAIAIPLAITGLLNPLFAAVAMASSSLVVVANSARATIPGDHEA